MSKINITLLVGLVVIGLWILVNTASEVRVVNDKEVETVVEESEEVVIDPIEQAKADLDRINKELDEKEQAGLAERKLIEAEHASTTAQLKAEYEAKLAEVNSINKEKLQKVDSELERIRETRSGF